MPHTALFLIWLSLCLTLYSDHFAFSFLSEHGNEESYPQTLRCSPGDGFVLDRESESGQLAELIHGPKRAVCFLKGRSPYPGLPVLEPNVWKGMENLLFVTFTKKILVNYSHSSGPGHARR